MAASNQSKIYICSPLVLKNEFEDRLEKAWIGISASISELPEKEQMEFLHRLVNKSHKDHEEVCLALIYAILIDNNSSRYLRCLLSSVKDGMTFSVSIICLIVEKIHKIAEKAKNQVFWLTSQLLQFDVPAAETIIIHLFKQIFGGDISTNNVWLTQSLLNLILPNKPWLEKYPNLLAHVLYTFLRLIDDHKTLPLHNLWKEEISLCNELIKERFSYCQLGRDFIRLLQNLALIPEFAAIWNDLLLNPTNLSPSCKGVSTFLSAKTSRRLIASRLTNEIEKKIVFLTSKVRMINHRRYLEWFQRLYLNTPESQTLIPDLIRYVCAVVHPSNEILCSDIIQRWMIIGWLLSLIQNDIVMANAKLALFYDWLFFTGEKDNIMNIEPAALLMFNSMKTNPSLTCCLMEFICLTIVNYIPLLEANILNSVQMSFKQISDKKVVSGLNHLFEFNKYSVQLKSLIKKYFIEFTNKPSKVESASLNDGEAMLTPPRSLTPSDIVTDSEDSVSQKIIRSKYRENVLTTDSFTQEKSTFILIYFKEELLNPLNTNVDFIKLSNESIKDNFQSIRNNSDLTQKISNVNSLMNSLTLDLFSDIIVEDVFDETFINKYAHFFSQSMVVEITKLFSPNEQLSKPNFIDFMSSNPIWYIFRFLSTNHNKRFNKWFFKVLNTWSSKDKRIGCLLLYFQMNHSNEDTFVNLYKKVFNNSSSEDVSFSLLNDLKIINELNHMIFIDTCYYAFQNYNEYLINNVPLIVLICHYFLPEDVLQLCFSIYYSNVKLVDLNDSNFISRLIDESLEWDYFEQSSFYKILASIYKSVPPTSLTKLLNIFSLKHFKASIVILNWIKDFIVNLQCKKENLNIIVDSTIKWIKEFVEDNDCVFSDKNNRIDNSLLERADSIKIFKEKIYLIDYIAYIWFNFMLNDSDFERTSSFFYESLWVPGGVWLQS